LSSSMLFLVCLFFSCHVVSSVGLLWGFYWVPFSSHVQAISFVLALSLQQCFSILILFSIVDVSVA
jgi:hypothetical protein